MSFDAFLTFDPAVEGESVVPEYEKATEILSFSLGGHNSINKSGGGMSAGKSDVSAFSIMKKTDKASVPLMTKCLDGTHFTKATVTFRKAGGDQLEYLVYEFEEVYVSSVQWSGSSGGDDVPTESVSFEFKVIHMRYIPQRPDGTPGDALELAWDTAKVAKA